MPTIYFEHKDLFKIINRMARIGRKMQIGSLYPTPKPPKP